jgi:hypothetical protein
MLKMWWFLEMRCVVLPLSSDVVVLGDEICGVPFVKDVVILGEERFGVPLVGYVAVLGEGRFSVPFVEDVVEFLEKGGLMYH